MTPPPRPNLEWLRNAARSLLKSLRAGDAAALGRLRAHLPGAATPMLSHAQLVVAREQGFPSWAAMKAGVEARRAALRTRAPSRRRAIAQAVLDQLIADARTGDPKVMADRPGVGTWCSKMVRDMLEVRPDDRAAVIATLLAGLGHPNPRVRFECAHALDTFGDASCRAPLVALMDDPVPRVRWMAMHALSCDACKDDLFGDDDGVRARIAARVLGDPSVQVRRHAVRAVFAAGGAHATATLDAVLVRDADPIVQKYARTALRRLGRRS
ncbi:HEAT repeat domain-containing protein [uncultured Phenylobacterium sp.]|uniref:HEAT repeat domain-containing protein n=1 Tax=uncultured Phenylobacterium sp. TaxID=349273 RepID=UPI0025F993E6|nr:HEAT repeat domain-containing protein [uncultured Phenylobacterium sp.]